MKTILAIIGSASANSSNLKLVNQVKKFFNQEYNFSVFEALKTLPHFDPELSVNNPPPEIISFRDRIINADGIIICTPEYIFSIPSGLKNAFEWCVATTIFSGKPVGIITASAHGEKGHEELKLILRTLDAKFTEGTSLLIRGVKGKVDEDGKILHEETAKELEKFVRSFELLLTSLKV